MRKTNLIVDAESIKIMLDNLVAWDFDVKFRYSVLIDLLKKRINIDNFEKMFIFIDFQQFSKKQGCFDNFVEKMEEIGFTPILCERQIGDNSTFSTVSTKISYILGMLAEKDINIILFSDNISFLSIVEDINSNRKAKVAISFLRRELKNSDFNHSQYNFIDLEKNRLELLGNKCEFGLAKNKGISLLSTI